MALRRVGALVLALLVALGCGGSGATPADVADAYFRSLAIDPIRTLPLLTPEFHRRHGLRVATAADAEAAAERRASADPAAALAVDRHQLAWLAIQSQPGFAKLAASLSTRIGDATEAGDTARVSAQIAPRDGPPFEQRFALVRASGAWRIDAIEQAGVVSANAAAAFAAWPNEAARRALAGR